MGEEFIKKIEKIENELKRMCNENRTNYFVKKEDFQKALSNEFEGMKFNDSNLEEHVDIEEIWQQNILNDILNQTIENLSDEDRVDFFISAFGYTHEMYSHPINTIELIANNITNEQDVYKLISREEEYIDDNDRYYSEIIKNLIRHRIPEINDVEKEIERLQNSDGKVRQAIIEKTSAEALTKWAKNEPNIENINLIITKIKHENIGEILESVDNDSQKAQIIDRYLERIPSYEQQILFEDLIKYIPVLKNQEDELKRLETAKNYQELNILLSRTTVGAFNKFIELHPKEINLCEQLDDVKNCIESSNDDISKAIMIMSMDTNANTKKTFYDYIQDDFYKMKISEGIDIYDNVTEEENIKFIDTQIQKMLEYKKVKESFDKCNTEKEKTEYITKLQDNDMKIALLTNIEDFQNREQIINSLTRYVDKDIEKLDNLAQEMIMEFFEDAYDGKMPQDKKEKMMIALKKNNCEYGPLERNINGEAIHTDDRIIIEENNKDNDNLNIGFLVHEYAHMLANVEWKKKPYITESTIEEGNADLFSDLVINKYLEKHPDRDLGFEIDVPYQIASDYDRDNGVTRTLLYPLEKQGKDIEAMCEYMVGDKYKYLEMVLSPKLSRDIKQDIGDNISKLSINFDDMYACHEGEYLNPYKSSIYLSRNDFIENFISRDEENDRIVLTQNVSQEAIEQVKNAMERTENTNTSLEERAYQISDNKKKVLDKLEDRIVIQREEEQEEHSREQEQENDAHKDI